MIFSVYDLALQQGREANKSLFKDTDTFNDIRFNTAVFACFKTHQMQEILSGLVYSSNGIKRSFEEYSIAADKIFIKHLGNYIEMERDTLVQRMHEYSDWAQFYEDMDILPNLRWMPTTSITPDLIHKRYWEIGLTLPVTDPRWKRHRPGDKWGCKCVLEATDDEPTPDNEIPKLIYEPSRGLESTPYGNQKKLISFEHPYFSMSIGSAPTAVYDLVKTLNILPSRSINLRPDWKNEGDFYKYKGVGISPWADTKDFEDNLRCAITIKESYPRIDIRIADHLPIYKHPNPELIINDDYGDVKKIKSLKGITSAFIKANRQGCKSVVINLDKIDNLDYDSLAKYLYRRADDFIVGTTCYLVRNHNAMLITIDNMSTKTELKSYIKNML